MQVANVFHVLKKRTHAVYQIGAKENKSTYSGVNPNSYELCLSVCYHQVCSMTVISQVIE